MKHHNTFKKEMLAEIRRMNRFIQKLRQLPEARVTCRNFAFPPLASAGK